MKRVDKPHEKETVRLAKATPVDYKRVAEFGREKASTPKVRLSQFGVRRLWDNYQIIGEVIKSTNRKFVVAACTVDGYRYLSITEFYYRVCDCTWQPSSVGITVPVMCPDFANMTDDGLPTMMRPLDALIELIDQAKSTVETMELVDPDNRIYIARRTNLRSITTNDNNSKENQE